LIYRKEAKELKRKEKDIPSTTSISFICMFSDASGEEYELKMIFYL